MTNNYESPPLVMELRKIGITPVYLVNACMTRLCRGRRTKAELRVADLIAIAGMEQEEVMEYIKAKMDAYKINKKNDPS